MAVMGKTVDKAMKNKTRCYIGIGSNIDEPLVNVGRAIIELGKIAKLIAGSSMYLTKPWGYLDQPDFINAVVLIETNMSAAELLQETQKIEKMMGRTKTIRWGPRLIDLDILTYGNEKIREENLIIPHPHMLERVFVLAPLAEIDESYIEALEKLPKDAGNEIVRLEKEIKG